MFSKSLHKGVIFITLLSVILQSFAPFPLNESRIASSQTVGAVAVPIIEPSSYQAPVFQHPEPRTGIHSVGVPNAITKTSNLDIEFEQAPASTPIATPAPQNTPTSQDSGFSQKSLAQSNVIQAMNDNEFEWILNGSADTTTIPGAIKITDDNFMQAGSAWINQQIDLNKDFDMTFRLFLGAKNGADGMAFVLQNAGTNALGDVGRGIGYWGISPSFVVEIDTYYNPEQNDPRSFIGSNTHNHIAIMKNGNINHDGSLPYVMPFNSFEDGAEHAFRFQWNATTKTLIVSSPPTAGNDYEITWLTYTEDIVQTIFNGDSTIWVGFTGATAADRNLQYFYPASDKNILSDSMAYNSDPGLDGNISCAAPCSQAYKGGPINTRTGIYDYFAQDISLQAGAGNLIFARTYSSLYSQNFASMGYGWTHNHDLQLSIGSYGTSTNIRSIFLKGHTANRYQFTQQNGYSFTTAEKGVYATLIQGPSSFILTDKAQGQYEFNLTTGRLISHTNPTGQKILYTYDSKGRLTKISDQSGQRYLTLAYSGNGTRIVSLTDHTGRRVSYGYDSNNNLVSVTDTLGKIWRYTYDSSHRILQVLDPNNAIIERTEYDAQGRAVRQYDGENNLVVELIYNSDGTTTVKDALNQTETHVYDSRKTLKSQTDPTGAATSRTYDSNFRPTAMTDENGNSTSLVWDANGADLLQVKDPLNGVVSLTYEANHKPISVVDQNNHLTTYTYSGVNMTGMTDALNATWSYSYTTQGYLSTQTDPLGRTTSYTYNAQGQRLSMTDPLGKTWTYAYDNLGRLVTTTDPLGRVTRNEYDAASQLIKVTRNYHTSHPQNHQNQWNIVTQYQYDTRGNQTAVIDTYGQITSYQYDNAGRLIKTTDPAGGMTLNTYDARGQLMSVTDALGRVTSYEYDAAGRVVSVIDPLGNTTSTTYNLDGTIATTRDALNRVTSYSYDELKRIESITNPMGGVTTYAYDTAGNMTAVTDPRGATTEYEYDALGRLIRQIAPNGGVTETFYDAVGNRIQTIDPRGHATTYTYDGANRLLTITDARGGVTRYAYDDLGRRISTTDANNRTTTYSYDALDRVVSTTDPLGNTSQAQYNAVGSAVSQTDANNNTTTFQYDALYRLVTQTNALNGATQFTYDLAGNQLTVKNPNNQTVTTTYDALNRPVSVVDANGNSTSTAYDAVGNLVSATDGLGNTTTFGYDALNRQVSMADALGNLTQYGYNAAGERISATDANGIVTRFEYNNMGWLTAVVENYKPGLQPDNETNVRTEYAYDLNGNRLTIKDGRGQVSNFTYDELNRLVQESDPLGNTWTYYYDAVGNQTSVVDSNGATTQFAYDNANRLVGIDYPGGTPDVTFAYDAGGRRTTMTDGAGTTSWTFDSLNRPTAIQDPFGVTVGYGYDAAGNRTSMTYPGAGSVTYTYDAGNRLIAVNSNQFSMTGYQYDSANRLIGVMRPNGVNTSYTYDNANRLLALAHTLGGQDIALYQYTYNPAGNRIQAIESVAYPEGAFPTATPVFTETPTVLPTATATMTDTETSLPSATPTETLVVTYTPTFSPTETPTSTMESPTGTATEVSFNGGVYFVSLAKAPKATKTPVPTNTPSLPTSTPTSSPTASHTPSPTPMGPTNTPTITNTPLPPPVLQIVTIDYTYDALNRLTAADYSDGKFYHYAYDPVGNRISQQTHLGNDIYVYDDANRLASVNGKPYTWDNNGNLLDDGANLYTYDVANRLVSVNGTTSYAYNGLGDRLTENGTHYTLDLNTGLTQVLADGTNTYLYGLGRIAERQDGIIEYHLGDALGSVRQLTNNDGEVVLARSYDPYGNTLQSFGAGETVYGFTGETTDANGLIYLRARHYSPGMGRFLTRDTWPGESTRPLSLNRWGYVEGDPVNFVDPTGHWGIKETQAEDANKIVTRLKTLNINIAIDWGELPVNGNPYTGTVGWIDACGWAEGAWLLSELRSVESSVNIVKGGVEYLGGNFLSLIGPVTIRRELSDKRSTAQGKVINLRNTSNEPYRLYVLVHELGHILKNNNPGAQEYYMREVGSICKDGSGQVVNYCHTDNSGETYDPGTYGVGGSYPYGDMPSTYSESGIGEDFAEVFTLVVSKAYIDRGGQYKSDAQLVYNRFPNKDIGIRHRIMRTIIDGGWRFFVGK